MEGGLICQVKQNGDVCGTKLGSKKFNLKHHLERYHKNIFKSIVEEEQMQINSSNHNSSRPASQQQCLTKFFQSEKISVSMTKEKFKRHVIQLVVNNGVALNLLSSPAFVGLKGEMAQKLGVSLRSHSIRNMILYEAEKQKKKLKEELHDKFLFFKDRCTHRT